MKLTVNSRVLVAAAAISANAFAQLPPSRILTVEVAQIIVQEAVAKCRADGYRVTVLVVDGLNAPKALLRDDGVTASTVEAAKLKATTTMLYDRPSGPVLKPGEPPPRETIAGTLHSPGALPIKVGEATIGAVAVVGTHIPDVDLTCARAGLAKVADKLK